MSRGLRKLLCSRSSPFPGFPLAQSTASEEQLCFAELRIPTQPCKALQRAQAQTQSRYLLMGYGPPKPLWLLEIPSSARLRQHAGSPLSMSSPRGTHARPDPQQHGPSSAPQRGSGPRGPAALSQGTFLSTGWIPSSI